MSGSAGSTISRSLAANSSIITDFAVLHIEPSLWQNEEEMGANEYCSAVAISILCLIDRVISDQKHLLNYYFFDFTIYT